MGLFLSAPDIQMSAKVTKSTHTERYRGFIEVLKAVREDKGITQQEVADALHKPQSFVSKYESGERRLDVVEFIDVCEAMRLKPSKVLGKIPSRSE